MMNSWQQVREDIVLAASSPGAAKHRANIQELRRARSESVTPSFDKTTAGLMRECNEKEHNDDNSSNERIDERWM